MDIQEFYCTDGFDTEFKCFDGRWQFEFNYDDRIYGQEYYQPQLKWIDMFGIEDNLIFKFDQPKDSDAILTVIPLTTRFAIMHCRDIVEDEPEEYVEEPTRWWIMELNWSNKKCKFGTETFTCDFLKHLDLPERACNIWMDQADRYLNESDLHFIVYKKEEKIYKCKYCKIDAQKLEYQQIGSIFELPVNLFNCANLNGKILSGFSTSRDVISFYDLSIMQILTQSSLPLQGLQPSICLDLKDRHGFHFLSNVGAWTSTHLYLWSEEKKENEKEEEEDEKYFSYIYEIEIKTGTVKKLSHKFDGRIRQMFFSFDGHILVHLQKFLRKENYQGPAWSKMLYGKKPFFEFKMFCLKLLKKNESKLDDKTISQSWQADTRYIQTKNKTSEAQFE